jgi:hypothetical protein
LRVRLIHVTPRRGAASSRREERLDVPSLGAGRGTDNELELGDLAVSLHHARFAFRGDEVWVESLGGAELRVGGKLCDARRIAPGDVLRIGPFELRALEAGAEEDLALEVERRERRGDDLEQLLSRTRLGIERGALTRRKLAWILGLGIAGAFVAFPLARGGPGRSWSSGPLARGHAPIANDCRACHAAAFERVRNESCLACHGAIGSHARAERSPGELDARRCAGCHHEHNGAEGLARVASGECSGCHGDLQALVSDTELGAASDFGAEHPEFRLHVLDPATRRAKRIEWKRGLREQPGVRFSHLRHVGQVVPLRDGTKGHLRCDACHRPDAAGRTMQPIVFEAQCRDCHSLGFDLAFPDRQALHGDPVGMRRGLREAYSELAIRDQAPDAPRFGVPGQPATREQRRELEAWVERRVRAAEATLMEDDGECRRCHELRAGAASDGGTDVAPVAITQVWMPRSAFRHATHAPFPCRDCHAAASVYDPDLGEAAERAPRPEWSAADAVPFGLLSRGELATLHGEEPSETSQDVLVPGIERCRSCHAGPEAAPPMVASDCVLCHPFHRPEYGSLRDRSARAVATRGFH